MLIRDGLQLI